MESRKRHYLVVPPTTGVRYNPPPLLNNYDMSKYHYMRSTRYQRSGPYGRKNEFVTNCRNKSIFGYPKKSAGAKKGSKTPEKKKTPEEVEEEERRKKLSDTANKLLCKIKTWSAEKSNGTGTGTESGSERPQQGEVNRVEVTSALGGVTTTENKRKRIAHSKDKVKLMKNKSLQRRKGQRVKRANLRAGDKKYEVNTAALKDFQNRIQNKLISEIISMPRDYLQNMLTDPKINPIMQGKLSQLVKENKLLIAQQLRALAESKMSSNGDTATNSQILADIDELIDPVIETDLSVLPIDLIRKMENIFQVEFDYSGSRTDQDGSTVGDGSVAQTDRMESPPMEDPVTCDTPAGEPQDSSGTDAATGDATDSAAVTFGDATMSECDAPVTDRDDSVRDDANDLTQQEDLSLYECSTDEDEEEQPNAADESHSSLGTMDTCDAPAPVTPVFIKREFPVKKPVNECSVIIPDRMRHPSPPPPPPPTFLSPTKVERGTRHQDPDLRLYPRFASASCQTDDGTTPQTTTATQTTHEVRQEDSEEGSLLAELRSIQARIAELNDRRLVIFLKLFRSGKDLGGDTWLRSSLVEALGNGSPHLMDLLKRSFRDDK